MKMLLLALFMPAIALAQNAQEFKIKGKFTTTKQVDWVYLRYSVDDRLITDSLKPGNGEYKFEGQVTEPMMALISFKYVKLPGEPAPKREIIQFFLEPSKIEISTSDSLQNTIISGSVSNKDYVALKAAQKPFKEKMEAGEKAYGEAAKNEDLETMRKLDKELNAMDEQLKNEVYASFVKNNPGSPIALHVLRLYAGYDLDPAKVEPLFLSLPASTQNLPSGLALKNQIEIAKKTSVGNNAMDFSQSDTAGNPVTLSSFRGKYVLLYFWASWCSPCRRENPNIVNAFNHYKERNFTILGVSLDRPGEKEKWLAAIHNDGLKWTQVSDLNYFDNEVAKLYNVKFTPQNLLIDPKGKILAKNVMGEALLRKLEEHLPQ